MKLQRALYTNPLAAMQQSSTTLPSAMSSVRTVASVNIDVESLEPIDRTQYQRPHWQLASILDATMPEGVSSETLSETGEEARERERVTAERSDEEEEEQQHEGGHAGAGSGAARRRLFGAPRLGGDDSGGAAAAADDGAGSGLHSHLPRSRGGGRQLKRLGSSVGRGNLLAGMPDAESAGGGAGGGGRSVRMSVRIAEAVEAGPEAGAGAGGAGAGAGGKAGVTRTQSILKQAGSSKRVRASSRVMIKLSEDKEDDDDAGGTGGGAGGGEEEEGDQVDQQSKGKGKGSDDGGGSGPGRPVAEASQPQHKQQQPEPAVAITATHVAAADDDGGGGGDGEEEDDDNLLPEGWDWRYDDEGRALFVVPDGSTTYDDPREEGRV